MLVFEHLKGPDLKQEIAVRLKKRGINHPRSPGVGVSFAATAAPPLFDDDELRRHLLHLLKATLACHCVGLTHHDIKPNNLVLMNEEKTQLKLIDLGLSVKRLTGLRGLRGTGSYMAPEILSGKEYGRECDIWACGLVLFELITGGPLVVLQDDDEDYEEWMEQIRNKPKILKRVHQLKPKLVDEQAFSFLSGLLEYDPAKRLTGTEGCFSSDRCTLIV